MTEIHRNFNCFVSRGVIIQLKESLLKRGCWESRDDFFLGGGGQGAIFT